ncbi:hypothetical protein H4R99_000788 [Coemansia sp. RSA 1722]|nr:hypothetical protein LPJ57_000133 [Coemansia sp. RSA 486]KAJ2237863.1 hypothetical protein IWW45_000605 [Coemansia sp. RSA 485]KAJ2603293.1 hypothetical protein GGF39_000246 [Coemansia sp. RSA 1721]KAJ2605923.1 hypothetical protein H4R99_000788 [Coemansia sp. RSA 1722]KAJ2639917.1 hypothetical protein GGF40_000445 [Coemansia sp. RSA 1286]
MPRTSAASAPASPAVTKLTSINNTNVINKKSENMDKLFSIVNPAGQQAAVSFGHHHHDDRNPYILPSFADNFEAWAYPETQQAVFEDWIATATPPCTTVASPSMEHAQMLAAGLASFPISPSLSPLSTNLSLHSSPLVSNDVAFSMASTMQQTAATAPVSAPIPASRVATSASFSVADYAAVLFPDIASSLSTSLNGPAPSVVSQSCNAGIKRALSDVSLPLTTPDSRVVNWASDLAGIFDVPAVTAMPATASPTPEPVSMETAINAVDVASAILAAPADPEAEQKRKLRDTEFLASLPPQLALKRRRTSNTKQKEKILAELLSEDGATAANKTVAASAVKKAAVAEMPAPVETEVCGEDGADESADAAALKRKKNTDAARRSRMRKILRIETLEGRVSELETENSNLAQMVAALEAEKAAMAKRMAQMESGQLQAAQFAM